MVYSLKKTIHFLKLITFALFMNAIYTYVLSTYLGGLRRVLATLAYFLKFYNFKGFSKL